MSDLIGSVVGGCSESGVFTVDPPDGVGLALLRTDERKGARSVRTCKLVGRCNEALLTLTSSGLICVDEGIGKDGRRRVS